MTDLIRIGARLQAVIPALTFLAILAAWEALVRTLQLPQWMLPSPSNILSISIEWAPELLRHSWVTLYETLLGFTLAIAIALPLAVLIAYTPLIKHTVYPILLGLQSVPKVALAPLVMLWFGFGILPKVIVVFLVCFFPVVVSATTGLEGTTSSRVDLMRSMQASAWQVFVRLRILEAMPHIIVGCKIAITFAVIGAVIAEFVGSEAGLGYLITTSTAQARTPLAFSAIGLLTIISIVLYYAIELVERIARWDAH